MCVQFLKKKERRERERNSGNSPTPLSVCIVDYTACDPEINAIIIGDMAKKLMQAVQYDGYCGGAAGLKVTPLSFWVFLHFVFLFPGFLLNITVLSKASHELNFLIRI